jgi:HemY protein
MLRLILYLIVVGAIGAGAAWLASNPGELTVTWFGYRTETSVFAAVAILVLLMAAAAVLWSGVHGILTAPRRVISRLRERRERRAREALRHGIFAVGAGDAQLAARYASEARQTLEHEPLTKLLRAQAAQLSSDHATAKRIFETMLDEDETRLMGLHGLFLEAQRENRPADAERLAASAIEIRPALPWASEAVFELQYRKGDWSGALKTLATMRRNKVIDRKTADRRRAVLLTAQAQAIELTDQDRAGRLAIEAHGLAPDLVPAAEIAGRVLAAQGYVSRAAKLLTRTWELSPHPDIALTYAYVRPGDSPRDRLNRVRALTRHQPEHVESRVALAAAAVDAHAWDEARAALEPLLTAQPSRRVCTLMARIEAGETRNAGRVREWLAKAVRAARDPAWVADGVLSDRWAPVSPVTGRLDAFEWRVPVERLAPGGYDALPLEIAELEEMEGAAEPLTVEAHLTSQQDEPRADTAAGNSREQEAGLATEAPSEPQAHGRQQEDHGRRAGAGKNGGAVFALHAPDDPGSEGTDGDDENKPAHKFSAPLKSNR